jgi:membrane-associated phospholipid phosphatase
MSKLYVGLVALFLSMSVTAQTTSAYAVYIDTLPAVTEPVKEQPVYKLNLPVDLAITTPGTLWSLYAFSKIYSKDPSNEKDILALDEKDVPGFDRWGVRKYNKNNDKVSYIPFYVSMPLPAVFLLDKRMRKDMLKLSFMYLEAMSITGLLYTGSTYFIDRYRPYVWSKDTDMDYRIRGGGRNSFYAGHVALVATSTFFVAQVFADYHKDSKWKWAYYTAAGATTGVTAYLRHRGGLHFPSDILIGITQGTLTGLLVPKLHKTKLIREGKLVLSPFSTGQATGLAAVYKF